MTLKPIAVDTSVLCYWFCEEPPEGQETQWAEAMRLFDNKVVDKGATNKGEERYEICVPSIVVAEACLHPDWNDAGRAEAIADLIRKGFTLLQFDLKAAKEMTRAGLTSAQLKADAAEQKLHNDRIKADWMIAATAAVNGAALCSYDKKQRNFFDRLPTTLKAGTPADFMRGETISIIARGAVPGGSKPALKVVPDE